MKVVLDRHKLRAAVAEKLVVSTGCLRGSLTEKQNRAGHVGVEAGSNFQRREVCLVNT